MARGRASSHRRDSNHKDIKAALEACGWHVEDTSQVGGGFPDLVIGKAGRVVLVEIKDGAKPISQQMMTPAEDRCYNDFLEHGVRVVLINSVEAAIAL